MWTPVGSKQKAVGSKSEFDTSILRFIYSNASNSFITDCQRPIVFRLAKQKSMRYYQAILKGGQYPAPNLAGTLPGLSASADI
jgi:hypothetical protein